MSVERNLIKMPDYSPWFSARIWKFGFQQNMLSSERASQEEQNFSSVAPSSEELWVKNKSDHNPTGARHDVHITEVHWSLPHHWNSF